MREFLAVTKALADPQRVRILVALRGRELCVCQIVELIGLAPSTVSKHLSILHQARLLAARKDERWVYYRLAGRDSPPVIREALDWVRKALGSEPQSAEDARRLRQILKMDPKALCQLQVRNRKS